MSLITRKRIVEELDDGCVLYLPFWENAGTKAEDLSGLNNHGSISASAWVAGVMEYALQFTNASLDCVTVPHNNSLNVAGNQFSISMWVKRNAIQADFSWWMDKVVYLTSGYYAFSYPNDPNLNFGFHGGGAVALLAVPLTLGVWSHVATTLNGTLMTVYKDGAYVDSMNAAPIVGTNTLDLHIGAIVIGAYAVAGIMDEIRLYNRELSATEIFEEYYRGARLNY